MPIQPISANNNVFNQVGFNVPAIKPNYQTSKVPTELAQDSVELSNKKSKSKKIALAFLGLAGIAGATFGIVSALKKGKMPSEVASVTKEANKLAKEAQDIAQKAQEEASTIYQKMEKSFQEVTDLFHKVQEPDYQGKAKLTGGILEEFDEAENITRKSNFTNDLLDSIEECNGKTKNVLKFEDGKPAWYIKGIEDLADGSSKSDFGLYFKDGQLSYYGKGYEELADGSHKSDVDLLFLGGKLSYYGKGYEELADGSKRDVKLAFADGQPICYDKGIKELADGSWISDVEFDLIDGKWQKVEN